MIFQDIVNAKDLVEYIKNNSIIIYGAGFVANFFYSLLSELIISERVQFIITSNGGGFFRDNIPIKAVENDIPNKEILVCVAVHESSRQEVFETLKENGFTNYLWIYPFLYDIWLGEPVRKNVKIEVKKIWENKRDKYATAVRYLAIKQYFGEDSHGYELYKKAMILPQKKVTVDKRLCSFINMVKEWKKKGYDQNKKIRILDDYFLVDGNHRLAAAIYFGQKYLNCDIYAKENKLDIEMVPYEKRLVNENMRIFNFTENEIMYMDDVIADIDGLINNSNGLTKHREATK